ncbi:MAG: HlyD family efflux transporter periplasmic adaptor subunit [Thermomonas sp.]|nr:HlyD family efflux transporter periplasmic adaptor subunit [Thermomonas sp.]
MRRLVDAGEQVKRARCWLNSTPAMRGLQASAAQADMARLGGDLERYRKLVAQNLVSQSAFDAQQAAYRAARAQYDLARNQSAYTRLLAPRDGVIANRQAEAGQTVAAGQPIFLLAGDGGREVAIGLPEARIRDFHTGPAGGGRTVERAGQASAGAHPRDRRRRRSADAHLCRARRAGWRCRQRGRAGPERARLHAGAWRSRGIARAAVGGAACRRWQATVVWVVDPARAGCACRCGWAPTARTVVPVLGGVDANAWVVAAGGHLLREGAVRGGSRQPAARAIPQVAARGRGVGHALSTSRNGRCATARWCCT